jgi:hypothetical protein
MFKTKTYTIDKSREKKLREINNSLERTTGLKIGESYIVRIAIERLIEDKSVKKIILDHKSKI